MGRISSASEAATLVRDRFYNWSGTARAGFNSAYSQINAIIDIAKLIAVENFDVALPVGTVDIPDAPPYLSLLDFGKAGMSAEAEQALWEQGLERARQILQDRLDDVRRRWAALGRVRPDGTLAKMIMAEIDKYEDERRALNLRVTGLSYDLAADFARTIISLQSAWSSGSTGLRVEKGLDEAQLRLRQAEVAINQLIERMKLQVVAMKGGADIASQLVSAAFVGTSASASVYAGYSNTSSSVVGTSTSKSTVEETATATRTITSHSTSRRIDNVNGEDITEEKNESETTNTTTGSTDTSERVDTHTQHSESDRG